MGRRLKVIGLGIGAECRHREPHILGTDCGFCARDKEREARIHELEANRPRLIDYLKMKQDAEDWHGVQDAASDLRDLDSELDGLRY